MVTEEELAKGLAVLDLDEAAQRGLPDILHAREERAEEGPGVLNELTIVDGDPDFHLCPRLLPGAFDHTKRTGRTTRRLVDPSAVNEFLEYLERLEPEKERLRRKRQLKDADQRDGGAAAAE